MISSYNTKESGFSIIENLVAIAILGIASVATVPLLTMCFSASGASRNQTTVLAEIEGTITSYRNKPYVQLLQLIASNVQSINNGQSVTITEAIDEGRASLTITLTAIKNAPQGFPEAVRVSIVANQRRGQLGVHQSQFETIITQVS